MAASSPDEGIVPCSERVLAAARALLATTLVLTALVAPHFGQLSRLADATLLTYVVYSFLLLLALHGSEQYRPQTTYLVHIADIFWPALLSTLIVGPISPFLLGYVFVVFAAAFRWGLSATLLTLPAVVAVLASEFVLFSRAGAPGTDRFRLLITMAYLAVTGLLAGYLGEKQQHGRYETAAMARLMRKAGNDGSFKEALAAVLDELLRLFDARRAVIVFQDMRTHNLVAYDTARAGGITWRELRAEERPTYLFRMPAGVVVATRCPGGPELRVVQLARETAGFVKHTSVWPDKFMAQYPFQAALAAGFSCGNWTGRLYLLNSCAHSYSRRKLRLLLRITKELAPVLQNTYLLRRWRKDAAAGERAKIARTLHDGVVQCLFGLEMRVLVLRKRHTAHQQLSQDLGEIQRLLHDQLLTLRELVHGAKTFEVTPDRLVGFLAETVERFRRDTEIRAHFRAEGDTVRLSAAQSGELARILQEALVNIRKHSGARAVLVRLATNKDTLRLVVEDDGGGLDFSGSYTLAELEAAHQGPAIIKDRVRSMGADLVIESFPWRGTRLEITVSQEAYAAHTAL